MRNIKSRAQALEVLLDQDLLVEKRPAITICSVIPRGIRIHPTTVSRLISEELLEPDLDTNMFNTNSVYHLSERGEFYANKMKEKNRGG